MPELLRAFKIPQPSYVKVICKGDLEELKLPMYAPEENSKHGKKLLKRASREFCSADAASSLLTKILEGR
jgi:hypothetical protein